MRFTRRHLKYFVLLQIRQRALNALCGITQCAQCCITSITQQTANLTRNVAMVYHQSPLSFANTAFRLLRSNHFIKLIKSNTKFVFQMMMFGVLTIMNTGRCICIEAGFTLTSPATWTSRISIKMRHIFDIVTSRACLFSYNQVSHRIKDNSFVNSVRLGKSVSALRRAVLIIAQNPINTEVFA